MSIVVNISLTAHVCSTCGCSSALPEGLLWFCAMCERRNASRERSYASEQQDHLLEIINDLRRSNAALKGVITKLKKGCST
jgi:uncharacterized Zn finger protein (UPF0148 family)